MNLVLFKVECRLIGNFLDFQKASILSYISVVRYKAGLLNGTQPQTNLLLSTPLQFCISPSCMRMVL